MTATVLHEDGTGCAHRQGRVRAGGVGFWCPAGIRVTHVRVGEQPPVELAKAIPAVASAVRVMAAALAPMRGTLVTLAELARWWADLDRAERMEPSGSGVREPAGDPCGDGELDGQMALPGV